MVVRLYSEENLYTVDWRMNTMKQVPCFLTRYYVEGENPFMSLKLSRYHCVTAFYRACVVKLKVTI